MGTRKTHETPVSISLLHLLCRRVIQVENIIGINRCSAVRIVQILNHFIFFNTIFVSIHMYPENPEATQVIVGSMNMRYLSDTARSRTHYLFRPKWEPIPLGYSDGHHSTKKPTHVYKIHRKYNNFDMLSHPRVIYTIKLKLNVVVSIELQDHVTFLAHMAVYITLAYCLLNWIAEDG